MTVHLHDCILCLTINLQLTVQEEITLENSKIMPGLFCYATVLLASDKC